MKHCYRCKEDKVPTTAITPTGLVEQCPACQCPFDVDQHLEAIDSKPTAAKAAPARPVAASAKPGTTTDLIGSLRARLAFVEGEIAARDGYLTERATLKRMLAAAGEAEAEAEAEPVALAN